MSNAQIIKNYALMNCILAFDRRRQTSFLSLKSLERAKKILTHALALIFAPLMDVTLSLDITLISFQFPKDSTAALKDLESVTLYFFGWIILCLRD